MYFNMSKRLILFVLGTHFGLSESCAEYFKANVDEVTSSTLTETRQLIAKDYSPKSLHELAELDKETVIDWSNSINPFRSDFHVTLKDYDNSSLEDLRLKPHFETAITKVKFQILGVDIMTKFMALKLKPKFELKDSSVSLSPVEVAALNHFNTKTPHVSLFKMMGNDNKDIQGINTAWKIESKEEQEDRVFSQTVKTIDYNIELLKKLDTVDSETINAVTSNIKSYFYSMAGVDNEAKVAQLFANTFYNKYKKYFENVLHINRTSLKNTDEQLMEAYIKNVFLRVQPEPETVPLKEAVDGFTHEIAFEESLTVKNFSELAISNRQQGDSKNNFLLIKAIIKLMNFRDKKEFIGHQYTTSRLPDISHWLAIREELEKSLKGQFITFSGATSIADTLIDAQNDEIAI